MIEYFVKFYPGDYEPGDKVTIEHYMDISKLIKDIHKWKEEKIKYSIYESLACIVDES